MSQPRSHQTRPSSTSSTSPGSGAEKPPMAEARPSASVILLSPTNQVLLLHRVRTSTSFPSAHVFPGGNISPFHESGWPLPPPGSPDRHRDSPAYRLAAIRETFEESGILLARRQRQRQQSPNDDDPDPDPEHREDDGAADYYSPLLSVPEAGEGGGGGREEARRQVHSDEINFQDWVRRDLGGVLCDDELVPFTRWVTPPNQPKRFTTQMYLFLMPLASSSPSSSSSSSSSPAAAPGGVVNVDVVQTPTPDGGVEHTAATFADAREWLRRQARGEIVLFPPQCYLLTLVAEAMDSVPVREGGGEGGGRARYAAQRKALLDFVGRTPAIAQAGEEEGEEEVEMKKTHPTELIPWSEKVMSPHTLFIRDSDRRLVLGVDKPGPELKGSGRGGDFDRVVLVKFTKQGPEKVEVRNRVDVLREEKEAKERKKEAAKL